MTSPERHDHDNLGPGETPSGDYNPALTFARLPKLPEQRKSPEDDIAPEPSDEASLPEDSED